MKEVLRKLGLNDTEINLYLTLLPLKHATASVLSYRTGLHRATAGQACKKMVSKGFLKAEKKDNAFIFTAESPEKFLYLLNEKEEKIKEDKAEINRIMGDLKAIMNPNTTLPQVKYFTGKEGFIRFCEESLLCQKKEILFATSMENFRNVVTDDYDLKHYVPTRVKKGISLKLLCVRSELTERMRKEDSAELRQTRFLPEEYFIKNTVFIFDDVTTLISNEEYPCCIMIRAKEITDTMRTLYNFAWQNAEQ